MNNIFIQRSQGATNEQKLSQIVEKVKICFECEGSTNPGGACYTGPGGKCEKGLDSDSCHKICGIDPLTVK